jgi:hypothetical protein
MVVSPMIKKAPQGCGAKRKKDYRSSSNSSGSSALLGVLSTM